MGDCQRPVKSLRDKHNPPRCRLYHEHGRAFTYSSLQDFVCVLLRHNLQSRSCRAHNLRARPISSVSRPDVDNSDYFYCDGLALDGNNSREIFCSRLRRKRYGTSKRERSNHTRNCFRLSGRAVFDRVCKSCFVAGNVRRIYDSFILRARLQLRVNLGRNVRSGFYEFPSV